MNDERLKFNSTFKQFTSRTTQNSIVIIPQMSDRSQYITFFTFSANNYTLSVNGFSTLLNNSNFNISTSVLIDELIIDFILQKTKFLNSTDVKQKTFDRYSKFRFVKNFSVNSLTDLIVIEKTVLVKANSVIVKAALVLFVKTTSMNFYESKSYKKIMIDAQHKMN